MLKFLERKFFGLPAQDSARLLAAKRYQPITQFPVSPMTGLYRRQTDPLMYGAIAPANDADDLLSSQEVAARASELYKLSSK
jgi:hypothetical protein